MNRPALDWHSFLLGSPANREAMGRRERRRCETRERIFRAAMNLFRDHGFQRTTVEDITDAADVGKGTFFNYFPSKEHVLGVLGEIQLAKYEKALSITHEQTARDGVRWLYHALPSEAGSSPKMVRSLLTVFLTSEDVREFLTEGLKRARGKLGLMFEHAQRTGEIPLHQRPEVLAYRFQQSLFGSMVMWTLQTPAPALEGWLDNGFDFFWTAVTAPPTAGTTAAKGVEV
jgi:AcrR family transcriptional regulator